MKHICIIISLCLIHFSCIRIQYSSSSPTGLGTNQRNSKKILKKIRKESYGGIFGKLLFEPDGKGLQANTKKKMQAELNRIGELIYTIGNKNWSSSTFGVPNILVPKVKAIIVDRQDEHVVSKCIDTTSNYIAEFSLGLIKKLYLNSVKRALTLQSQQSVELDDFADFKIKTIEEYFDALFNLKGAKAGIFTAFSDDKLDKFEESMNAAVELERISNYVSLEFFKGLLFIMSHENYHAISNCEISKESETEADLFAAIIYQQIVKDNSYNQDAILNFFFGDNYSSGNVPTIVEFISGRKIFDIIENIYKLTDFEAGSSIHMPLEERLTFIESKFDLNNIDAIYLLIGSNVLFKYGRNR